MKKAVFILIMLFALNVDAKKKVKIKFVSCATVVPPTSCPQPQSWVTPSGQCWVTPNNVMWFIP